MRFRRKHSPHTGLLAVILALLAYGAFHAAAAGRELVKAPPFDCRIWSQAAPRKSRAAEVAWTLGRKRLLYYRVRFLDTVETEPVSVEDASRSLAEANRLFERMSYGQFSIEWTITPVISLNQRSVYYQNAGFAGLLFDVRDAAGKAGIHAADFDLDLVRCPQIPGFPQGQANLHQAGAVVHADLPGLYVHELGHCLGLYHANAWQQARPGTTTGSTPPFPSNISEYSPDVPVDAFGLIGNGDLRSPGQSAEYGDFFDLMGAGAGDYNAAFKHRLAWLKAAQVHTVSASGVYRIHAYDLGSADPDKTYALRIPTLIDGRGQNFTFRYWISWRSISPDNVAVPVGVQIHWIDQAESYTSQLLDMQPLTPSLAWDSALPLGRTYTDPEAGLHITPLAVGKDDRAPWVDVQVEFDVRRGNRAPSLAITPVAITVQAGDSVDLSALGTDPDGDSVSYFWNLGDDDFRGGSSQVSKSWNKPGRYVVRCEASDGRGGLTSRQILVRVGGPGRFFVEGRVLTPGGDAVAGAFVSCRRIHPASSPPEITTAESDTDGRYVLSRLSSGIYELGAQVYGHVVTEAGLGGPFELSTGDRSGRDFLAIPVPAVTVEFNAAAVKEGKSALVTFTRDTGTNVSLAVPFLVNGSAGINQDFASFGPQRVTIPAGSHSVSIPFEALADLDEDPDEQVQLTVVPASEEIRMVPTEDGFREITYYYPGWEPRAMPAGELKWFQTAPSFRRGPSSTASILIVDTTPPGLQRVSVLNEFGIVYERPGKPLPLRIRRVGSMALPLTIRYSLGGTAVNGVDYARIPLEAIIPAGDDHVDVVIAPIADAELEGDELIEFNLLASDGYMLDGNTSIQLAIQEDEFHSSPQRIEFAFRWGAGLTIRLHGEYGKTYVLESSPDLAAWASVSTVTLDSSPVGIPIPPFSDRQLFYRSRQVFRR